MLCHRLIIFIVLNFGWVYSAHAGDRETRTLTLDNGLAILLIHDSGVDRSATALSVGTGHCMIQMKNPVLRIISSTCYF